jgi:Spy/CpxP family protein refolding chaperone
MTEGIAMNDRNTITMSHIAALIRIAVALTLLQPGSIARAQETSVDDEDMPAARKSNPNDRMGVMLSRLLRSFDLTPDHADHIRSVLEQHEPDVESALTALASARQELRDAIGSPKTREAAIRNAAAALAVAESHLAQLRAAVYSEVSKVLSDEQRVRLVRFTVAMEEQIRVRERALGALWEVQLSLTPEQEEAVAAVAREHGPALDALVASVNGRRLTLLVLLQQTSRDRAEVAEAARRVEGAYAKLALCEAQIHAAMRDAVDEKALTKIGKSGQRLDAAVVARYRAGALLFLHLL